MKFGRFHGFGFWDRIKILFGASIWYRLDYESKPDALTVTFKPPKYIDKDKIGETRILKW